MYRAQEGFLKKTKQEWNRERLEKKIEKYKALEINARNVYETIVQEREVMERELTRWQ